MSGHNAGTKREAAVGKASINYPISRTKLPSEKFPNLNSTNLPNCLTYKLPTYLFIYLSHKDSFFYNKLL